MNATTSSERRGDLREYAGILGWGALYITARFLLEMDGLSGPARTVIAIVPVPVFGWVLWSISKGISRMDELQQRMQLEALAFAFPLTILMLMTLGLLEVAVDLNPDDWSYRHVWPFLYLFYVVGLVRAKRRYA